MKTKLGLLGAGLLLIQFFAVAQTTIVGDKKIITREIEITEYDNLELGGPIEFIYQQSAAKPHLEIEVDENILPYLDIEIKAGKLIIKPQRTDFRNLQLKPSVCIVRSNSRELKKIALGGSASFTANQTLSIRELKTETAGGSRIQIAELKADKLKSEIAGGGRLVVNLNAVKELECSVAGGGVAELSGQVTTARMKVAGGGRVEAYDCTIKTAKCEVAGGGRIEIHVTDDLNADVAGGGKVRYKGNPTVKKSTVGGGSVKPAE